MGENIKDIELEYKGYRTIAKYCSDDNSYRGVVEEIWDYVDFQTSNVADVEKEFHSAVDDYISFCAKVGKTPEKKLILGEKTILSDPCYDICTWCSKVVETKPGNYFTDFTRIKEDDRISSMMIFHESILNKKDSISFDIEENEEDILCVDSGTMCICDSDYYENMKKNDNKDDLDKLWDATDFYQENINYKPYKETDEFNEKRKERLDKIIEICEKYHVSSEPIIRDYGEPDVDIRIRKRADILEKLAVDYFKVTDEEMADVKKIIDNSKSENEFNCKLKELNNLTAVYSLYVKNEILNRYEKDLIELSIAKGKYEMNVPRKIYMPMAAVVDNKCFVSSSGYGDGCYPFYLYKEDEKVVAIKILFIDDEEDEEDNEMD